MRPDSSSGCLPNKKSGKANYESTRPKAFSASVRFSRESTRPILSRNNSVAEKITVWKLLVLCKNANLKTTRSVLTKR